MRADAGVDPVTAEEDVACFCGGVGEVRCDCVGVWGCGEFGESFGPLDRSCMSDAMTLDTAW